MTLNKTIDINCDVGESIQNSESSQDRYLMPYLSSCNIACGGHAGNVQTIERTIGYAMEYQVAIGAHPSYVDFENFGRVSLNQTIEKTIKDCREQIHTFKKILESKKIKLHHVKPHGALYNDIANDKQMATAYVEMIQDIDPLLELYFLSGSPAVKIGKTAGLIVREEAFVDRNYASKTKLRSRTLPEAVIYEKSAVLKRICDLLKNTLILYEGNTISIKADTICIHSDTPNAVQLSQAIYTHLQKENVRVSIHK